MSQSCVEKLLKDAEHALQCERRAAERKSFMRPVSIASGRDRDQIDEGFSRDLSTIGIGIISRVNWAKRTQAHLTIHTLTLRQRICVTAEARWSEPFGKDWYITGWKFIAAG